MKKILEFYITNRKITIDNFETVIPKKMVYSIFMIILYIILIILVHGFYKLIPGVLITSEIFGLINFFLIYTGFYIVKNKEKLKKVQGFSVISSAKLLGIDLDKDDETTIKKRYRELSKKWHPDKFVNDTIENQDKAKRNFQKLNTAYTNIKNYKNIL